MKKVSVIGLYCTGREVSDGQSIKTRTVTKELERTYGTENVRRIDTFGWKKNPLKLFARCIAAVQDSEHVIFMTDEGGIKVFPWMLRCANVFAGSGLHYVVVGGWLPGFMGRHPKLARWLRGFDSVLVETTVMRSALEALGFENVALMLNFKELTPLSELELQANDAAPLRLCMLSRVMREKGVGEAVRAVDAVNGHYGKTVFTLDIYGQVDPGQIGWFEELKASFPPEVRYGGVVAYDRTVQTLRDYFALLFPTAFYTEGIPGTIIDAYAAGVPVIASRWESFGDSVEDGVTGIGYPFEDRGALERVLLELAEHPERLTAMKRNCLKKAEQYRAESAMQVLLERLNGKGRGCK